MNCQDVLEYGSAVDYQELSVGMCNPLVLIMFVIVFVDFFISFRLEGCLRLNSNFSGVPVFLFNHILGVFD